MQWIQQSGVGTLVISWYYPGTADQNGAPWDSWLPTLMDIVWKYELKVIFHLEPYPDRTALTIKRDVKYIIE